MAQLGHAMQLRLSPGVSGPAPCGSSYRLHVRVDAQAPAEIGYVPLAAETGGAVAGVLRPCAHWGGSYVNFVRLSLIFARQAEACGGVLIHGALAEWDGKGVILAAPGGTGKTTASERLPAPWRSLCDDTTLVVRDPRGQYWAHPWPTWSRFLEGGPGGTWDVQRAVPVAGIFCLTRATANRVVPTGPAQAVSLLGEYAKQASTCMPLGLCQAAVRALHLQRFENLCALARAIPAHVLHIGLTGAFWQELERTLQPGVAHA